MLYAILVVLLVAADQLVKILVRANIPMGASMPFLPGLVELTYVQNTGAAFSIFKDHTWLLTITLSVVLAGAVGNLIDRALFGFVTDMFNLQFMHFAVFNVADICVVCGGIAFCVYFLFFYDKLEKKEVPDDSHPAEG